jgi:hypothetical protein
VLGGVVKGANPSAMHSAKRRVSPLFSAGLKACESYVEPGSSRQFRGLTLPKS